MNNENSILQSDKIIKILLTGSGIIFVLAAVLYNEFSIALFDSNPPLRDVTIQGIRSTQIYFMLIGLFLIFLPLGINRIMWFDSLIKKPITANITLAMITILLPLSILEFSFRPLAYRDSSKTTIFTRDSELGWGLTPNAKGMWGSVEVKINGKGLRGPELSYHKPLNTIRILYLGDSVTFGYGLESYEQTFPHLIESILDHKLAPEIETINSGVGGYSPWQEYIYLSQEGIEYDPDLIVVSFVLNDVTEKFTLTRFGGSSEGFQIEHTLFSTFDTLFSRSGLVYLSQKVSAKIRFGSNVQEGAANEQLLRVQSLVYHPDDEENQRRWEITREDLSKIFDFGKERDIPVILVVFPFTFQFDDINTLSAPQEIVSEYAIEHKVPVIDLLPMLSKSMADQGLTPEDYFIDEDHLSPLGSEVVAEILADFVQEEGLVTDSLEE